jgi:DNA-binding MarR family transcriptional regulator
VTFTRCRVGARTHGWREQQFASLDIRCHNTYYQPMSNELQTELRQRKPFASIAEEAHLNLSRTESQLQAAMEAVLKPYGISGTQYNVLRILRGSAEEGLCRNEIRDRLINRMPDVTRLLDRMEEAGLVVRHRSGDDRRQVSTHLTAKGRELVDSLDAPVHEGHQRNLGHLGEQKLRELIELLTLARHPG